MALCAGIKRDGSRCTATVEPPQTYCWWHDPDNADKRRRAASKAAKSKPSREMAGIKSEIKAVIEAVQEQKLPRGVGAVVFQGYNTLLRAVEIERKVRELDELEERLEILESRIRGRDVG